MNRAEELVSVIVPIYNVEPYLDRCIKSIISQTYKNLEIILINDGSTDNSQLICHKWQERDSRISAYTKCNEGLGPTRNFGVTLAKGSYVCFVDSDDWIEDVFVEHFLQTAIQNQAELVVCDYKRIYDTEIKDSYRSESVKVKFDYEGAFYIKEYPEVIWSFGTATWHKFYKKELLDRVEFLQPPDAVEDLCTVFLYYIFARRMVYLREELYNYYQRPGSLMGHEKKHLYLMNALEITKSNYIKHQVSPVYREYIKKMLSQCIEFYHPVHPETAEQDVHILYRKLDELFPDRGYVQEKHALVFGSFNTRCAANELFYKKPEYFGFSGMISAMSCETGFKIRHSNPFRNQHLHSDINKQFKKSIQSLRDYTGYVIIDFLEERYHAIRLTPDTYVTESDAWIEAEKENIDYNCIIKSGTEEFRKLWEKSCLEFIELLKENVKSSHVVLIKMRLSEMYGHNSGEIPFENRQRIQQINQFIEELETYFLTNFPDCQVITLDSQYLYTDERYIFGCFPWHLNNSMYIEMVRKLRKLQLLMV